MRPVLCLLVTALVVLAGLPASAALTTWNIDNDVQSGNPGDTLTFNGDLTNDAGAVTLLGGAATVVGIPGANFTFNPLLTGFVMAPSASISNFPIFTVDLTGVAPGVYNGSYAVNFTGGSISDTFQITVLGGGGGGGGGGTPEPGTLALIGSGLALALMAGRKRKRKGE